MTAPGRLFADLDPGQSSATTLQPQGMFADLDPTVTPSTTTVTPTPEKKPGIGRMLGELVAGPMLGAGRLVGQVEQGIGRGIEALGGIGADDDPRTLNRVQRVGRIVRRRGESLTDQADLVEMQTTTGKIAKFAGDMGTEVLATLATAGRLPGLSRIPALVGPQRRVLGESIKMAVANMPITAARTASGEGAVQAAAQLLGNEELAETLEGNMALNVLSDLGLNTALSVGVDLGLARLAQLKKKLPLPQPVVRPPTVTTQPTQIAGLLPPAWREVAGEVPLGPAIPMRGEIPASQVDVAMQRAAAQAPPQQIAPGIEVIEGYDARTGRTQREYRRIAGDGAAETAREAVRTRLNLTPDPTATSALERAAMDAPPMPEEAVTAVLENARAAGEAARRSDGVILNSAVIPGLDQLKTEAGRRILMSGGLVGAGLSLQQAEDERLAQTGKELVGWGVVSLMYPSLKAAGIRGGTKFRDAMMLSPTGRKVLDAMSYDIAADPAVKMAAQDYQRTLAEGRAKAAELATDIAKTGPSARRRISDLVEGEAFEPVVGDDTPLVIALAQRTADEFSRIGRMEVDLGTMSELAFAKRDGRYLKRMYPGHMAEDAMNEVPIGGGRKVRIKGHARRLDLPDEVRNALGEIREADVRVRVGMERSYRNIASARLFNDLANIPGVIHPESLAAKQAYQAAKRAYDDSVGLPKADRQLLRVQMHNAKRMRDGVGADFAKPQGGYVRLPDTEGLGVLRGAVVRQDAADYLNQLPDFQTAGKLLKTLAWWKKSKTVWNPGTHVANLFSNVVLAHMGGLPYHKLPVYLARATKAWKAYDPDVKFLAERGVLERGLPTFGDPSMAGTPEDQLRALYELTRQETRDAMDLVGIKPKSAIHKFGSALDQGAQRWYGAEDGVFRVALFQELTGKGMPREEAADFVQKQFVDYSTRSPFLRTTSRLASPFLMFSAKSIPRVTDQILEHPVRWATLMALWGGMDQYSRRQVGPMDFNDLPENERARGYLLPGRVQLPMRGAMEEFYTTDVARWTPLSAITGSPAPGTAASQIDPDIPQILTPSGPLYDIGNIAAGRNSYTGESIFEGKVGVEEKIKAVAGELFKFVSPTAAGVHLPRVVENVENLDFKAAMVDALGIAGLRPRKVVPGNEAVFAEYEYNKALGDARQRYEREIQRAERNPSKQERLTVEYEERLLRVQAAYLRRIGELEEAKALLAPANTGSPAVQFTPR